MHSPALLAIVASARATIGDHPFVTFAALAIVGWVISRLRAATTVVPARLTLAASIFVIVIYALIAIWYAAIVPSYYDHAEPSVAAIAWLFDRGLPIYHAADAAERYAHIYGPLAFMLPGWLLRLTGPSIVASKLAGVLAAGLSVVAVYRLVRSTTTTPQRALALTALFALLCLT